MEREVALQLPRDGDLGAAALRYQGQVNAYLFLLTSRYPDSSPVLAGPAPTAVDLAEEARA